ncbi:uncharacterized protein [Aegilops tauschii subsp. strangulata]|uniref:uncharacterized protein n=1 Tax=Aegilops tauschii subsp. strangulata TaxID=200361 RepID=UPI00098BB4E0|nr:uncharacterized protein LOC109779776 [Aegilops tauschii subsp. strangulata]
MPNPGGYALVLNPTIVAPRRTCKFSRVLIDDGSSINILYRNTITKLGLEAKDLEPTQTIFHGIVPSISCSPTGRVQLDVLFGNSDHFRREPLWFEVVDLSNAYHALLGRPALAKFMAVPHYTYLKMKLSGPKGLITITGDYRKSLECARHGTKLAESLVIAEERRKLNRIVALASEMPAVPIPAEEPTDEASFKPSKETKKVKLNLDAPSCSKYVVVGTRLDSK